jgi:hypothetical protein
MRRHWGSPSGQGARSFGTTAGRACRITRAPAFLAVLAETPLIIALTRPLCRATILLGHLSCIDACYRREVP